MSSRRLLYKNHKTWVEVCKKALRNNARIVRGLLQPENKLMAVVKSNAYGHGLVETASLLSKNSDWLGVDNLDEAILLRQDNIKSPILVMGYTPAERFQEAIAHDLRLTIYDTAGLKNIFTNYSLPASSRLRRGEQTTHYKLHVKIDTGMSRQGVTLADLPKFLSLLRSNLNRLKIEGVFTHFANADNLEDRSYPNLQLANFKKALAIIGAAGIKPAIRHASATTGLFTMSEAQFDMARIGIAFYGLWPSIKFASKFKNFGLSPTLNWKTRVAQIKKIKKGTPVGYGITERVKKDSTIAILPVGYYDGYFRSLSSAGEVLVGGRRCRILGRISMNLSVIDISNTKNAKVWDEVVLIGGQGLGNITAEELAEKAGTISYEVVSRINPLLPRIYL